MSSTEMRGGRLQQRGMGAHTLCASCNNNTGAWYVPELVSWTRWGVKALRELPPREEEDRSLNEKEALVRFSRVHPLRLLKQIVTMLLAVNGPGPLREELAPFVLDRHRTGIAQRYQFYLSLVRGTIARSVGVAAKLNVESRQMVPFTEIAYTPFAYLMTIDTPCAFLPAGNISHFADYGYDDKVDDLDLWMGVGFVHTPYPADYRSKAAIERDAVANAGSTDSASA